MIQNFVNGFSGRITAELSAGSEGRRAPSAYLNNLELILKVVVAFSMGFLSNRLQTLKKGVYELLQVVFTLKLMQTGFFVELLEMQKKAAEEDIQLYKEEETE